MQVPLLPLLLEPGLVVDFSDPRLADAEGLVAVGGDLSAERLLRAYDQGVFPWFDEGLPELWWSPDPRAVLPLEGLHVSRSLRRQIRKGGFRLSWNEAFDEVIFGCAMEHTDGTWITEGMIHAYSNMHRQGHAHSLEVWQDEQLIGGIYGVQRGALFAAESMFHRRPNASKIALVALVRSLLTAGMELFDVQFLTPHLASMGAVSWSREEYLEKLSQVREKAVDLSGLEPSAA